MATKGASKDPKKCQHPKWGPGVQGKSGLIMRTCESCGKKRLA